MTDDKKSLTEQAASNITRPPYWRDVRDTMISEAGPEFEQAFFEVQQKLPIWLEADADNPFHQSHYATLPNALKTITPVMFEHDLSLRQFSAAVRGHGEGAKKWFSVPICTKITHVPTLQYEMVIVDIPVTEKSSSHAAAFTYGRRIGLVSYWSLGVVDQDGVQAFAARAEIKEAEDAANSIAKNLDGVETTEELEDWLERNSDGLKLLSEHSLSIVRGAYHKRKQDIESAREKLIPVGEDG